MKKSNTLTRIITASVMAAVVCVIAICEYYGLHLTRWVGVLIGLGMIAELLNNFRKTNKAILLDNKYLFIAFTILLILVCWSFYVVGARPWIILLLLMTIAGADIGAWLSGKIFGGDKMWERLSEHKTWSGQIGGIICGTLMCVLYGLLGTDVFRPELLWIGIGVSLLSQYGDLTASAVKRHLGIKDFSHVLPGHGGLLDRFDGWIYILPLIWFILM
ncbi:MAG: phosphatidate cytidylyltransferase [Alphaproteobacteria bacterium]|nr:phosphatidate cytidylyltransferase [Alphaproteobacteria bacterium]